MEISPEKVALYICLMSDDSNDTLVVDTSNLINTQAHKRIQYPDGLDYEFYIKEVFHYGKETLAIWNKHDMIIEFVDDAKIASEKLKEYNKYGDAIKRRIEDRVRHFQKVNPQYYVQTYEEANWVHKAVYMGFRVKYCGNRFNPYDNWFGVSKYYPEAVLLKGNKKIVLSMQGFLMPNTVYDNPELKPILDDMSCRYLGFSIAGEIVYETFTGELPDMDFIENFITQ